MAVKRPIAVGIDILLLLLSTWLAFSLRLDVLHVPHGYQWLAYGLAAAMAVPVFSWMGLYKAIFRYSGLPSLVALCKASAIYGLLYAGVLFVLRLPDIPRTVGLLQPLLALMFVGGWRTFIRAWYGRPSRASRAARQRVLIYGAGSAGRRLMAALQNSQEMQVSGFVDDDRALHGRLLNGLPIVSMLDVPEVVRRQSIAAVLLAIPSLGRARRNQILDELREAGVHVRTLPGLMEIAQGRVRASDVRELDIEDLLGRDPVQPRADLLSRQAAGRVVLVTGAGGSIGRELCRQLCAAQPEKLVLVDQGEFSLYSIHHELQTRIDQGGLPGCTLVPVLCSVRDPQRLEACFEEHRPDIVFHAAAYKHVPLVERNVVEGASNNVYGTWVAARCAVKCAVGEFVLISTDKAVRPTNVMGATKRLAEMILQALAGPTGPAAAVAAVPREASTRFSIVRFGNVLGSSGSVVPLFRQQIRDGGPLTVTHKDVTRFFMTIPEAAQLVLQASAMARGGEVFVLDMGQPVRIVDLARRMIELSGFTVRDEAHPDGDIEIVISGLRAGEKLHEELLIGDNPLPTDHPRIMKARESYMPMAELEPALRRFFAACDAGDASQVVNHLAQLVSGFTPSPLVRPMAEESDAGELETPVDEIATR